MNKRKKSSTGYKRRQKTNGQTRLKAEHDVRKEGSDRLSIAHEAKRNEPASRLPGGRRSQQDEDERKRKLWERKQAELEARWATAQSRQTEEDAARKRTMKITCSITGAVMAVLLCVLAWYFAKDGIHINTPA
jgi:hypothetical protein